VGDRLKMVELAIRENPLFLLSSIDIDRPGPHYSVQTVELVSERYPDSEYILVIGGDSLHDLPTWHEPLKLTRSVTAFGVMRRPGDQVDIDELENQLPGIKLKTLFLDTPMIDISAQKIRERVSLGEHFRYYLTEAVYEYICTKRLYRKQSRG